MCALFRDDAASGRSTIGAVLQRGRLALRAAGIEEADLEGELLLRHALGLSRVNLLANTTEPIEERAEQRFLDLLDKRRRRRVPAAYLTGHREFYDLDLCVGPGVLIPRPETEHVVEEVLRLGRARLADHTALTVIDVGTGSGAIALAVSKHQPAARVLAADISAGALAVADFNAKRLRLAGRITFLQGDLLEHVHEPVDIIAANLPYIASGDIAGLQPEVRDHEPRAALDGGPDGLRLIARLLAQAPAHLRDGHGAIVLEIGAGQADELRRLAADFAPGWSLTFVPDLAGISRVAVLEG